MMMIMIALRHDLTSFRRLTLTSTTSHSFWVFYGVVVERQQRKPFYWECTTKIPLRKRKKLPKTLTSHEACQYNQHRRDVVLLYVAVIGRENMHDHTHMANNGGVPCTRLIEQVKSLRTTDCHPRIHTQHQPQHPPVTKSQNTALDNLILLNQT